MNSDQASLQPSRKQNPATWRLIRGFLKHGVPTLLACLLSAGRPKRVAGLPLRIMIVRADGLGDFILFIPFLRCIRSLYPNARICLVVRHNVVDIAEMCPYVDDVLAVADSQGRMSIGYLWYLTSFARQFLRGRFDLALQPRWDVDRQFATLLAYLTRAPRIIGYTETTSVGKTWENRFYNRLFTEVLPPGSAVHEAERNLNMVRYMGGAADNKGLEFWFRDEDRFAGNQILKEVEPSGSLPVIAFGVGAGEANRRWPFYSELIRLLLARYKFVPVIVGGPQDVESARRIQEVNPNTRLVLSKPLRQVGSFLSQCDLFVGNDSGPMHLAAAAGVPIVAVWCHPVGAGHDHANSPARFGPLTTNAVIIRPTHYSGECSGGCLEPWAHCIQTISADRVAAEIRKLVNLPVLTARGGQNI